MTFTITLFGSPNPRRSVRRIALLASAGALLFGGAGAAAETLMDAVTAAYGSNPDLVAQRFRQKAQNEVYVQTRAQYGPQLSLSATAQYNYTKYGDALSRIRGRSTDANQGDLSLNLRQPVYTGGRVRGALAEARANVRASEETLRRAEGQIVREVIVAYAAVLRDRQRLDVARQNVMVLHDRMAETRARRRVTDVTVTDLAQADLRLAAGESQLANAESQLAISEGEYLRIVGNSAGELAPLPTLPGLPDSIDEALTIADAENALLERARFTEEASRANIAEQRGNQRPTATISAEARKVGQLSPFNRHDYDTDVVASITVTQQLFQAGAIRSRIRQAQADNSADQAAVDAERRQALQDVVTAWSALSSNRVAVVSGTRQVESAQVAFAGMQREERFGLRSTIEVLNAEQELASSQLGLLGNRFQEYVSRADLLLAMGRLDARTVNAAIPATDPDAEFERVRSRGMLPIEPVVMMIDHVASASPNSKRKPDLRGANQPKPTTAPKLPPQPSAAYLEKTMVPITQSPLLSPDQLPPSLQVERAPGPDKDAPR